MNRNMIWAYGFIGAAVLVIAAFALFSFDRGPVQVVQRGFRGTAMEANYKPEQLAEYLKANEVPEVIPDLGNDGPKASEVYQNVQVLGHLSEGEFNRTMLAITSWVAPEQGCTYCHNPENMASEEIYTYKVARKMLQMTQTINADWNPHVGGAGVTCYTCHRGNPVPAQIWFHPEEKRKPGGMAMVSSGQNTPSPAAGLASLPTDPFTPYLENNYPIRVQGASALPQAGVSYELDAIAAVVIGGTSLTGGVGSVVGTLFGALIIAVINNGLDLMGVSSYYQQVIKGAIIVLAALLDTSRRGRD